MLRVAHSPEARLPGAKAPTMQTMQKPEAITPLRDAALAVHAVIRGALGKQITRVNHTERESLVDVGLTSPRSNDAVVIAVSFDKAAAEAARKRLNEIDAAYPRQISRIPNNPTVNELDREWCSRVPPDVAAEFRKLSALTM